MTNIQIRQFKNQIITFMNGIPLEVEVKRLVIREILDELTIATEAEIQNELKTLKEAKDGTGMATDKHVGVGEQPVNGNTSECDKP